MVVRYGAVRTFAVTDGDDVVGAGCFGNALLARETPADVRTVALPQAAVDAFIEPPGADHPAAGVRYLDAPQSIREPRCLLAGRVGRLAVGTTHLSHVGSGERLLQAAAVAEAMRGATTALLLGDLNAAAGAAELAPLEGWTDAFTERPGDPARVSTDDGLAIDHVLARGVSVGGTRVVREAGDLSDHFPIVAEVTPSS
jgi:endonuclease/exonuclease/phosphatase family metal-dependent hydrolase